MFRFLTLTVVHHINPEREPRVAKPLKSGSFLKCLVSNILSVFSVSQCFALNFMYGSFSTVSFFFNGMSKKFVIQSKKSRFFSRLRRDRDYTSSILTALARNSKKCFENLRNYEHAHAARLYSGIILTEMLGFPHISLKDMFGSVLSVFSFFL